MSHVPIPLPGQLQPTPAGAELIEHPPAAEIPKPTTVTEGGAPQVQTAPTIEDRLTQLEKEVSDLKAAGSSAATLAKQLDDAGILRAHPAQVATPGLRQG